MTDIAGAKWKATDLWEELMVVFHFSLRIGEMIVWKIGTVLPMK